jgi:hypothetical protein
MKLRRDGYLGAPMDKAFVITGSLETVRGKIQVGGVYFSSKDNVCSVLGGLGFSDLSIEAAEPLTKQPTEPTFYYFDNSPHSKQITVVRFNNEDQVVNTIKVQGDPSAMIPPVEGKKAEEVLYVPKAFLIKGNVGCGLVTPVYAILLVKPKPKEKPLRPDGKVLKRMGISKIFSVEEVNTEENNIGDHTLYLVERSPSAKGLTIAIVSHEGERKSEKFIEGDPKQLLPSISGNAAEKFFKNNLGILDAPKTPMPIVRKKRPTKSKRRSLRR